MIERFHQTLKNWLRARPAQPATRGQLQAQLDTFALAYSTQRPHRSLSRRTPLATYLARPKTSPATSVGQAASDTRIRRDRLDSSGVITLRHDSRLHHIGLGRRYAGTRVLVLARDRHIRVLTTDGVLLRELTLDPGRDYQPQARP